MLGKVISFIGDAIIDGLLIKGQIISGIMLIFVIQAQANDEEHKHHQYGTHIHGAALLNIALDTDVLQIELESPAMNIVGFEHQADSQVQSEKIKHAISTLKDSKRMFKLPDQANCNLLVADITTNLSDTGNENGHDTHAGEDSNAMHSEFHASYQYRCNNMAMLDNIDVLLIPAFPGIQTLQVQAISASGQSAKQLSEKDIHMPLPH